MESEQRRPLIVLNGESLGHGRGKQHRAVLHDLSLELHEGERVALLGPSGAGKSTLLAALRARLGQRAAWCPQHHGLVPQLGVYHNVYMGRLAERSALANLWNLVRPLKAPWREIAELAKELGLDGLLRRPVGELSGGQRQRVAIARAFYQGRALFLGDEPLASVDPHQALRLLALIEARHATTVVVLHHRELALSHFDRVWGLRDGHLAIDAATRDLSLADLDALYPDADSSPPGTPPTSTPLDLATLPCGRGKA
ncbi:MAG: ATP-binding cassette domain-containing protein [Pseudomonadota bacterium]